MHILKTLQMGSTRDRRRRGFTLIELLVVIMILAILAAIIVPRVVSRTSDAKLAKAQSDMAGLRSALDQFRVDCDRYPTQEEGLAALREAPQGVTGWKGPYITKELPMDPWNHDYLYAQPGAAGPDSYAIKSLGPDGVESDDDISEGDK
jgi:general secretion pathway protein G